MSGQVRVSDEGPVEITDLERLVLDGLVHFAIAHLTARPEELHRAHMEAPDSAHDLGEMADRLVSPGNFSRREKKRGRVEALHLMATILAIGAMQPEGITWSGMHWCTAWHDGCPHQQRRGAA